MIRNLKIITDFYFKLKKNLPEKNMCAAFSGKDPYFAQR
jgi:hypothetical protein